MEVSMTSRRPSALARLGLAALGAGAALSLVVAAPAAAQSTPDLCPIPLPTPVPPADVSVHVGRDAPPAPPVRMGLGQTLRVSATSDCHTAYRVTGLAPAGSPAAKVLKELRSRPLPPGATGTTWSIYKAIGLGKVRLEATGVPVCPPGRLCPLIIYTFPIDVSVVVY
jgi:hypothetical protein